MVLVEELSAKSLLEGLLPKLLPAEVWIRFQVFEGKSDLERAVARRIRLWAAADACFLVLRDQDAAECLAVKERLLVQVESSGRAATAVVRIACRELESWILGDWQAVAAALDRPALAAQARKAKYRNPDRLHRPIDELRRVVPDYEKVRGARLVGRHLEPERNTSRSFQVFCAGVRRLVGVG